MTNPFRPVVILVLAILCPLPASPQEDRPDWIPVGSVPAELERHAVEAKARLESGSVQLQRDALRLIAADIDRFGRTSVRLAAVPLVADLLSFEYRVLQMPRGTNVPAELRLQAAALLGALGGEEADAQLRDTIRRDPDGAVRAQAAQVLVARPGVDPERDFAAVSRALLHAVQAGSGEAEVTRLLRAAREAAARVWLADNPDLLQALLLIYEGAYSSSLRGSAFAFLEELADR